MGRRPFKLRERKHNRSIRLSLDEKQMIEARHGKVQRWIDEKIKQDFGQVHEATVVESDRRLAAKSDEDDFDVSEDGF